MRRFLPFATLATAALFLGCQDQQWKIVFEGERDGDRGIYVVNPDGSGLQNLTPGGSGWEPTWSPDRSKILFASGLHGGGQADEEVYVMDADGSNMRRLTNTPGDNTSSWAADWSPDGQKIVFTSNRAGSPPGSDGNDLYVMNADGSNVRRLTRERAYEATPAWSPDGRRIAFMSNRHSTPEAPNEIYVMDADGTNVQRLTHDYRHAARPAWSPDGERIAFMSNRDGGRPGVDAEYEIYVMDADGTNVQRLTYRPGSDGHPDWSPDGSEIVFIYLGEGNTGTGEEDGIYVIGADGTNLRQLTAGFGRHGHPNW